MTASSLFLLTLFFIIPLFTAYYQVKYVKPFIIKHDRLKNQMNFQLEVTRFQLEDVELLAEGKRTRAGYKCRTVDLKIRIPESEEWRLAKARRYLIYPNKGWHPSRNDSPLSRIFRVYCDSLKIPCIKYEKAFGRDHEVIIDVSPLRTLQYDAVVDKCVQLASLLPSLSGRFKGMDYEGAGLLDIETPFREYPIWLIPELILKFTFKDERHAMRLAEQIAFFFAFPAT